MKTNFAKLALATALGGMMSAAAVANELIVTFDDLNVWMIGPVPMLTFPCRANQAPHSNAATKQLWNKSTTDVAGRTSDEHTRRVGF